MRTLIWSLVLFSSLSNITSFAPQAAATERTLADIENLVQQNINLEQTATAPELAKLGDWPVGVKTVEFTNSEQLSSADFTSRGDRKLKLEVWYPSSVKPAKNLLSESHAVYKDETRSGKQFSMQGIAHRDAKPAGERSRFPLLVISHGYTGYRTMMYYLAEHLASHGYVVASIDHTDSTNADVDFATNSGSGFPSTLYNRARDQQFVLESMNAKESDFSSMLKADSAALLGYSMGGYGALNTVGGCYNFSTQFLSGLGFPKESMSKLLEAFNTCSAARKEPDQRWRAMITFAPWGGEQSVHKPEALNKITIPSLFVAGEHDDVSGFENGVKKLFEQLGSKDKYLMVYENARHNIAAHPAPQVAYQNDLDIGHYYEPSWSSNTIAQINKHMALAFLDCHVMQSKTACNYLPNRQFAGQIKQADGTSTKPWPGFADRWGLGIQFIRGDNTSNED